MAVWIIWLSYNRCQPILCSFLPHHLLYLLAVWRTNPVWLTRKPNRNSQGSVPLPEYCILLTWLPWCVSLDFHSFIVIFYPQSSVQVWIKCRKWQTTMLWGLHRFFSDKLICCFLNYFKVGCNCSSYLYSIMFLTEYSDAVSSQNLLEIFLWSLSMTGTRKAFLVSLNKLCLMTFWSTWNWNCVTHEQ